ncbi:MAG TPA: CvpA family protein [Chthoniobacteraceae bacterium]|jgi:uncharacterized membrane protein required for colicin V production
MHDGADSWQFVLLAAAAILVLLQAWRGWRLGIVRQVISLAAIALAYAASLFGGEHLVPFLRPIGLPDQLLRVAGGALLGCSVFLVISLLGALLFKKTSDQSIGIIRLGYGATGAIVGGLFGVFLVWLGVLGIRVLGTVAETEVRASRPQVSAIDGQRSRIPPAEPSSVSLGLVQMKHALEQGTTGAVVEHVDPIPGTLYSILGKVGQMMSSERSVERFMKHPGVKTLTEHPKIIALQHDPEIAREVVARNYFALIRNSNIVAAANDPELGVLLRNLEFEKALDHALRKPEKQEHVTTAR